MEGILQVSVPHLLSTSSKYVHHYPWNKVLPEKLIVTKLLKKFPAFHGFTRAHYWSLSWATCIQFIPSQPTSLRSILLLWSHLCLRF